MSRKYNIEIVTNVTEQHFMQDISPLRKPVIIRGYDIGECRTKWSAEYLASNLGKRDVKIHVSTTPNMDFLQKNFLYKSLPFHELLKRSSEPEHNEFFLDKNELYYLRSLGDDPRKDVADIRKQFPNISEDIKFPQFFEKNKFFSSVFRVSSASICLWTHYDIMDNLLVQVVGRKRAVLYSPDDVSHLYMNGDKSEVQDIDEPDLEKFPKFAQATPYEVIMEPGDILFIPALWFHNMKALEFCIAVNIFWKNLDENYYDKKDPYGNKDLVSANQAMTLLEKGIKQLEQLPNEYRNFYVRRMIARLDKLL